jgi:hypothetical protein
VHEDVPRMVDLPAPRTLDAAELALLEFVLSGPSAREELLAQAHSALVVSACDCGCRSVGLKPDAATPSAPYTAEDSPAGNDGYIGLSAEGLSPTGTDVEVTLHIVCGRMTELEIWDGAFTQEKSTGELPVLKTLHHAEPH